MTVRKVARCLVALASPVKSFASIEELIQPLNVLWSLLVLWIKHVHLSQDGCHPCEKDPILVTKICHSLAVLYTMTESDIKILEHICVL